LSKDHELELLIRRYWESAGTDAEIGDEVLDLALGHPPTSPTLLSRAVAAACHAEPGAYAEQVETKLSRPWERTREVLRLVDALGDPTLDVDKALFDHLADGWVDDEALSEVDIESLGQARLGAQSRPHAARALLDALGWDKLTAGDTTTIRTVLDGLERETELFRAHVLLVTPDGAGLPMGINVFPSDKAGVDTPDDVNLEMNKQAHTVLGPFASAEAGLKWSLEWPLSYVGDSVGLGLQLAALVTYRSLRPDASLAGTGAVSDDGHVRAVAGVEAKLVAARDAGFQRVLLPRENKAEGDASGVGDELQLIYVDHIKDIGRRLQEVPGANEMSFDGRVRQARAALPRFGLSLNMEKQQKQSRQLVVSDAAGSAIIELWETGTVAPSGKPGSTKERAQELINEVFVGEKPVAREGHKFTLADEWRQRQLREALEAAGAQERAVTGASEFFCYQLQRKASKAQLMMWTSGKGYLTGNAPAFDEIFETLATAQDGLANIQTAPKPASRGPAGASSRDELLTEGPWIGTDESGKGDYFGPLVCSAVYADEQVADALRELGVQDSKNLTDKRVHALAPQVRQLVGKGRFEVTTINPPKYNELYAEFKAEHKTLNSLLAWGHTRSIEDLLKAGLKPRYAIVDQFADASYIQQRLLAATRESGLQIFQFPKAESDMAVAAASILARAEFLQWLARTSTELGMTLPKGASPQVIEVAKQIAAKGGRGALAVVAKLHFKTTATVLAA